VRLRAARELGRGRGRRRDGSFERERWRRNHTPVHTAEPGFTAVGNLQRVVLKSVVALPGPQRSPLGDPLRAQLRLALQRLARERCPGVRLVLLFGSEARGRATEASDVDVAVFAPGEDLLVLASGLSEASGREVDVVSLEDPGIPLLEELLRDAELLYEREPGAYATWRSRALTLLDIDGPAHARMRDAWLARVARAGV
jgi:predicted nucleotidyltransferase